MCTMVVQTLVADRCEACLRFLLQIRLSGTRVGSSVLFLEPPDLSQTSLDSVELQYKLRGFCSTLSLGCAVKNALDFRVSSLIRSSAPLGP